MILNRIAAAALVCSLTASVAQAGTDPFDVTGTWEGSMSCKGLLGDGSPMKGTLTFSLAVQEADGLVGAEITPTGIATGSGAFPRGASAPVPLCGSSIGQTDKPGKGRLNFSMAAALIIIGKAGIETFPGGMDLSVQLSEPNAKGLSGKATGTAMYDSFATLGFPGGPVSATCKVKITRTSIDVPGVDPDLVSFCATVADLFDTPVP